MNLLGVITIAETISTLVILVFLLTRSRKPRPRKNVSEDLQEIKNQIGN